MNEERETRGRPHDPNKHDASMCRFVVDSLSDGTFVIQDANLQLANMAFAHMVGYAPEEIVGLSFADLVAPEDRERIPEHLRLQQPGKDVADEYEFHLLHKDGETRVPVGMILTFSQYQGQVAGVAVVQDLTHRKRTEKELRESEERYRSLFERVPLGIYRTTPEGQFLDANPALVQMLGYPDREAMLAIDATELYVDPETREQWQAQIEREGVVRALEFRFRRRDGAIIWVRDSAQAIQDVDGKVLYYEGSVEDVTARKQLEHQIQESLERRGRQVQISTEVAQEIAATPALGELYRRVVTLVRERFGYSHVQIFRHDPESNAMMVVEGYGEAGAKMKAARHHLPYGRGMVGTAAATGQPVLAPDVSQEPSWVLNPHLPDTQGELAVPIKLRDEVLGVLDVQSDVAGALGEEDQVLLLGLAGQIAAAIESTRLVEQTQAALAEEQEAEQFLGTLMDSIPNPIFFKDTGGVYIGCNQAFLDYLGTTREQILGKSVYDLSTSKELADQYHEMDMELFRHPGAQVYESRVKYADGTFHDVIFNKASFHNPDGSLGGLIGTIMDISERKQAEAEQERLLASVQQSERLMRTLIDALPLYVYVKDTQGRNLLVNTAMAHVYGLASPEKAIGKSDFDFYPRELAEQYHASEQAVLVEGKPLIGHEEPTEEVAGKSKWHSSTKVPLRDEQGEIIGLVGITTDITERKQVEEALRESEEKYRTILNNIEDGYYEVDTAGNLVFFNDSLCRLYGYSEDELMGMNYRQYMDDETAKAVYQIYNTVYGTGKPTKTYDWEVIRKDGTRRFVQVSISLMRGPTGESVGFRGTVRDITERKRADEALERRALQLQTSAEVSQAASSILDPDELIQQVVDLVRERFGLYYAGLFLVGDVPGEPGEWAVLRAGTGEAGRQMLAQGHKLAVGGESMIGWCTANAQARIARYAGEDAVRLANPLLPDTRSEMALPLVARGQVIGAMTIHSEREAAFSEEDISVLQTMASQVANAIANARLFEQAQTALREMEATNRRYLQQAWTDYLRTAVVTSYETGHPGSAPLEDTVLPEIQQAVQRHEAAVWTGVVGEGEDASALVAPIALRGEIIGALGIHDEAGTRQWTDEEIALVEAVAERMAITAESLRLLDETQRRAGRERLIAATSARLRESLDVDTVLQTAVQETREALGLARVEVLLGPTEELDTD